jgi:hypothetical protein
MTLRPHVANTGIQVRGYYSSSAGDPAASFVDSAVVGYGAGAAVVKAFRYFSQEEFWYVEDIGTLAVAPALQGLAVVPEPDLDDPGIGSGYLIVRRATWADVAAIAGPSLGDTWQLVDMAGAPARPGGDPAEVGNIVQWSGTAWVNLGGVSPPIGPVGILGTGSWADSGAWVDNEIWRDF